MVDDGSTDSTQDVLAQLSENTNYKGQNVGFKVQRHRKENGGKHTAVNFGVSKAEGELTLILDSDDELPPNSLADVAVEWAKVAKNMPNVDGGKSLGGLCGYMAHRNGQVIGRPFVEAICDEINLRYVLGVAGDMSEVFRTAVLREFPFPEIKGERFCPEVLSWNRIAQKYVLAVFPKVIYIRDYLDGGLTDNIVRIRMRSPVASMMTYSEMLDYDIPFKEKVKAAINYWRFRCCYKRTEQNKGIEIPNVPSLYTLAAPVGWLMHLRDGK